MRNAFAPVNRIPPEVLSLIPDYLKVQDRDENLIVLTHVCHSFREIFISCSSLWTFFDFRNTEKTRVYIERSKCAPLKIRFPLSYREEALLLVIPHIHRLKVISAHGTPDRLLPVLVEHFSCPLPLLDELEINFSYDDDDNDDIATLPHQLFNGDLSSLHKLTLTGVITTLPWRDLSNLTTFNLKSVPEHEIRSTQLLDFFESAPNLRHIELYDSLPSSSNAPTERVVSLPHLRDLSIFLFVGEENPILNHLLIPAGASLHLKFKFDDEDPLISPHLSEPLSNLLNLSHITAINLCFLISRRYVRLNGPSGELYMLGNWIREDERFDAGTSQVMQYLTQFDISRTRWLTITWYDYQPSNPAQIAKSMLYRTLHRMEDLRTLMLIDCSYLPFIHILNPDKNPDKVVLCPKLEEITIYDYLGDTFFIDELADMARERALRGVKLSTIRIFSGKPAKGVHLPLREHVSQVEYEFYGASPDWDALPN